VSFEPSVVERLREWFGRTIIAPTLEVYSNNLFLHEFWFGFRSTCVWSEDSIHFRL